MKHRIKWIRINDTTEIMTDPVMEEDFGRDHPLPMPARGMSREDAMAWVGGRGLRLPTEEEWLSGWEKMNHRGLYEWLGNQKDCLRDGSLYVSSNLLASVRNWIHPGVRNLNIGFRCARDVERT